MNGRPAGNRCAFGDSNQACQSMSAANAPVPALGGAAVPLFWGAQRVVMQCARLWIRLREREIPEWCYGHPVQPRWALCRRYGLVLTVAGCWWA